MFLSSLLYKFQGNFIRLFKGYYLLLQIFAIIITLLIVSFDGDYKFYELYKSPLVYILFFPAVLLGALLPILTPITLLVISKTRKRLNLRTLGYALGQSALLAWVLSSLYKAVTGRVPPTNNINLGLDLQSTFHFGFLQNGIFWGWPSSHTTVAFAMAFTLIALYPKKKMLVTLVLLYALYIGIGVAVSNIHWFSDAAAGILMGSAVGIVVGKSFIK